MKLTKKEIWRLNISRCQCNSIEQKTYEFNLPIPFETGWITGRFPSYLKGFEKYYNAIKLPSFCGEDPYYELKEEYRNNRPKYHITITHPIYDVDVTEKNLEYATNYFNRYTRLAKQYADLIKKCDNSLD